MTVTVTASPVNDPPVAVNDADTVVEDSVANVIDVLANDSDPDGDTLTITRSPRDRRHRDLTGGGTVDLHPDRRTSPAPTASPTPSPTAAGGTDTAAVTVNVTVDPLNDAPDAVDDDVRSS